MTEHVPSPAPGVDSLDVEDDVLLFDGEFLHRLAGTAATVHRLLDGWTSVDQVVDALVATHEVDRRTVQRDVEALVSELVDQGLVQLVDRPTGPVYVRPAHVAHVRDGETAVLADLRRGSRQALTPSAAWTWDLVEEQGRLDAVLERVEAEHPGAGADVTSLLEQLASVGLLERRDG